jgi:Putative auto-transporter adhesin, head GIN domain
MKNLILMIALACFTFLACDSNYKAKPLVKGNGIEKTITRNISQSFDKIDVSSGIEVILNNKNSEKLVVNADENILPYIDTYVENNTLFIKCRANTNTKNNIKVEVNLENLKEINANSAAKIIGQNAFKGNTLIINSNSASEVNLETNYDNINVSCNSAAIVKLKGKSLHLDLNANSVGSIECKDLWCNKVIAQANSGAKIDTYPLVDASVQANSAGEINLYHTPKNMVSKEANSGGSINFKN